MSCGCELLVVRREDEIGHLLARDECARQMKGVERPQAGRKLACRAFQNEPVDWQQLDGAEGVQEPPASLGDLLVAEAFSKPRSIDGA